MNGEGCRVKMLAVNQISCGAINGGSHTFIDSLCNALMADASKGSDETGPAGGTTGCQNIVISIEPGCYHVTH